MSIDMENKTIYIVNSGEYSDFGVEATFSTKELAQEYMETFPRLGYGGYNDLIEMILDDTAGVREVQSNRQRRFKCFTVSLDASGNFYVTEAYEDGASSLTIYRGVVRGTVWAKDKEHASKIVTDYRMKALALNLPEETR